MGPTPARSKAMSGQGSGGGGGIIIRRTQSQIKAADISDDELQTLIDALSQTNQDLIDKLTALLSND